MLLSKSIVLNSWMVIVIVAVVGVKKSIVDKFACPIYLPLELTLQNINTKPYTSYI